MFNIAYCVMVSFLLLGFTGGNCQAKSLYGYIKEGSKLFQKKKYEEALHKFVDAQIEFPENPTLKYNIASTHYKMRNYEEAVKGYLDVAETAKDVNLEEKAIYNIGNAMYRQGKLEEAVEYYKKALELDPNDQDAKHNLEFVRKEIKKRLNESKKTAQKQQQQKKRGKQQSNPDQHKEAQKKNSQKKERSMRKKDSEAGGQTKAAQGKKQSTHQKKGPGMSKTEKKMTRQQAEHLLNSLHENREKFAKSKTPKANGLPYWPEKDW